MDIALVFLDYKEKHMMMDEDLPMFSFEMDSTFRWIILSRSQHKNNFCHNRLNLERQARQLVANALKDEENLSSLVYPLHM